mgnify:CR=1 FL=1
MLILTFLTNKNMAKTNIIDIKTVKITDKGQIAVPKEIRKLEGFRLGDKVAIIAFRDRIELRPLNKLNKDIFTLLASERSLAKDWLSKEDEEAWKDL